MCEARKYKKRGVEAYYCCAAESLIKSTYITAGQQSKRSAYLM